MVWSQQAVVALLQTLAPQLCFESGAFQASPMSFPFSCYIMRTFKLKRLYFRLLKLREDPHNQRILFAVVTFRAQGEEI